MRKPELNKTFSGTNYSNVKLLFKTLPCAIVTDTEQAAQDFLKNLVHLGFSQKRIKIFSTGSLIKEPHVFPELIFTIGVSKKEALEIENRFPLIPRISVSGPDENLTEIIFSQLENPNINPAANPSLTLNKDLDLKYKALLENSVAVILTTKPDGSILECNQAAVDLFGYSKEEIILKGRRLFIDHTYPEFHKSLEERLKKNRTTGTLKVKTKAGENLTCLFSSTLFEGEDGTLYSSIIITDITPRSKAIQELQKSEKRYKSLIQEASDMVGIVDENANYLFVSPTTEALLNHSPEFLVGKNAFEFIHPKDIGKIEEALKNATNSKRLKILPFRFKDGNGQWQWIETVTTNLLDEPSIQGIVVNSRVITEQIEMEQKLQKTLKKLQNIMDSSLDMISTIDRSGHFVSVSRASETILGYSPQELEGKRLVDFVHPEDVENTILTAKTIIQGKKVTNFENRYVSKNGETVPLTWSGYWNKEQNLMFAIARDGTEKLKADEQIKVINEELRLSNEKFLYSLKATNETIWAFDISTEEILWSEGIHRHYGYTPKDYKESLEDWGKKIHPEDRDRVSASFSQAIGLKEENFWFEKYRFIKKNGEISHVLDRGYIVRDGEGKPKKVVGAVLDITENHKKSLEIEEKNQKLVEITWMQSHVVRAPVAKILGLVDIIQNSDDEERKKEAIEYLKVSASELDTVTREIVKKAEKVRE